MALSKPNEDFGLSVEGAGIDMRFRAVAQASPDAFITIEASGRITDANPAAIAMFGYSEQEILGLNVTNLMPARYRVRHRAGMARFHATRTGRLLGHTADLHGQHKDGSEFPLELSLAPWPDGPQVSVTGIVRDTSRRKQREDTVLFRSALLDNATDSVFVVNQEGRLLFVNRTAHQTRGYTREELLALRIDQLLTPASKKVFAQMKKVLAKEGGSAMQESEHVRKDGSVMPVEVHARALVYEGQVVYAAVVRDISDRHRRDRLEHALSEIAANVAVTFEMQEIMRTVLEKATKALGAPGSFVLELEPESDSWVLSSPAGAGSLRFTETKFNKAELPLIGAITLDRRILVSKDMVEDGLDSHVMRAVGFRSFLGIPVIVRDRTTAIICFGAPGQNFFSDDTVRFAEKLGSILSLGWENARLYTEQRQIAHALQKTALTLPSRLSGLDFGTLYHSATDAAEIGGDFYDLFELDDNRIGIVLGDIGGKGIEAAALASWARSTVRAYAYEHDSPAVVMKLVNRALIAMTGENLITMVYGTLRRSDGLLTYCSAGHPPPFLVDANGLVVSLTTSSPMLGLLQSLDFRDESEKFETGIKMVLYTDGVIESRRVRSFFGEQRLFEAAIAARSGTPDSMVREIYARVDEFSMGRLNDDLALLVLARPPINK